MISTQKNRPGSFRTLTLNRALLFALTLALPILAVSQNANNQAANPFKFPCPDNEIARYTAYRASGPITIDGHLDEATWTNATWSPRFHDILTGGKTIHDTHACVTWDDKNLYVAYRVEEPFVHARFTNHNAHIYQDNDVEFFIAGRDGYYEFEINAYNTTYEVFFIWEKAYETGGFSKLPEFEKSKLRGFNGVGMNNHPRGNRLANFKWDFPGLKTAVHIDGTVNNDSDRDRGWTVEMAFPWKGMESLAMSDHRALPPKPGDVWRMDFSRFNTYKEAPPAKDSGGWVWSKHGIWDSHIPECFPYITFSTNSVSDKKGSAGH